MKGTDTLLVCRMESLPAPCVRSVAVLTCLMFGLIPAWRTSRVAAQDAMKASARSVTGSRYDIRPVGVACILLATAAVAASYLPARRAARLEPLTALREE
jgi:ABC-type lipoprotein release transport system permease subunit